MYDWFRVLCGTREPRKLWDALQREALEALERWVGVELRQMVLLSKEEWFFWGESCMARLAGSVALVGGGGSGCLGWQGSSGSGLALV